MPADKTATRVVLNVQKNDKRATEGTNWASYVLETVWFHTVEFDYGYDTRNERVIKDAGRELCSQGIFVYLGIIRRCLGFGCVSAYNAVRS